MRIRGYGATDKGQRRDNNEDSHLIDDKLSLFVVSDGMGGHSAGEVASRTTVRVIRDAVIEASRELQNAMGERALTDVMAEVAKNAVNTACKRVFDLAQERKSLRGMGCTLTMMLVERGKVVMAHVGDSRLYLLREGKLHQLSRDHTMSEELVKMGVLAAERAKDHPRSHILTRSIGTQPSVSADILIIDALPGDRYLLCSDGLHNYVEDPDQLAQPMAHEDCEEAARMLVEWANDSGGRDNITAVLVRVEPGPEIDRELRRSTNITGKLNALGAVWLFDGIKLADISRVLNMCEMVKCQPGDVLLEEGQHSDQLYVVVSGKLEIERGGRKIRELGVGEGAGEPSMLRPRPARASVKALEESKVLKLDGERFRVLSQARPDLGVHLLRRLGERLASDLDDAYDALEERHREP